MLKLHLVRRTSLRSNPERFQEWTSFETTSERPAVAFLIIEHNEMGFRDFGWKSVGAVCVFSLLSIVNECKCFGRLVVDFGLCCLDFQSKHEVGLCHVGLGQSSFLRAVQRSIYTTRHHQSTNTIQIVEYSSPRAQE